MKKHLTFLSICALFVCEKSRKVFFCGSKVRVPDLWQIADKKLRFSD